MLKKYFRFIFLVVFGLVLAISHPVAFAMPRVVIPPFENASVLAAGQEVYLEDELNAAVDYVTEAFIDAGRFDVLERAQLEKLLQEQELGMTGLVDSVTAPRIGKFLGAKYLFYGKITNVSVKSSAAGVGLGLTLDVTKRRVNVTLTGRLIDVETGRVVYAATGRGNSSTANTGIGFQFRDYFGYYRMNNIFYIGSTEVTQENVDNALYKAAFELIDNLMAKIDGKTPKRRR